MRARPGYVLLLTVAAGVIAASCSDGTEENMPLPPPSHAEGLITEIRPPEGEPETFLLETEEDGTFEVLVADDVDYGFDLEHLHEHMADDLPVQVELEERDGVAYALSIEDV